VGIAEVGGVKLSLGTLLILVEAYKVHGNIAYRDLQYFLSRPQSRTGTDFLNKNYF
jgi:hypothetical protein